MPVNNSAIIKAIEKLQNERKSRLNAFEVQEDSFLLSLVRALESISKITAVSSTIVGPKGDKGDTGWTGKEGYTPVKGTDYFTKEEIRSFLKQMTPIKGEDYFTDEEIKAIIDIAKPIKGKDYFDGEDGVSVSPEETRIISSLQVEGHEAKFDHKLIDPFLVGTKKVNESEIGKDKVLTFDGKELVYRKPTEAKKTVRDLGFRDFSNPEFRLKTITSDYTLKNDDGVVLVDASSGNITITLYTAGNGNPTGSKSKSHVLKRIDNTANTVTITPNGSETIEWDSSYMLVNRGSTIRIFSDSSNWFILSA